MKPTSTQARQATASGGSEHVQGVAHSRFAGGHAGRCCHEPNPTSRQFLSCAAEFLKNMFSRIQYPAFLQGATQVCVCGGGGGRWEPHARWSPCGTHSASGDKAADTACVGTTNHPFACCLPGMHARGTCARAGPMGRYAEQTVAVGAAAHLGTCR